MNEASPWTFECGDGPNGLLALPDLVDHLIIDTPYDERVDLGNQAELVRDSGAFGFAAMDEALRERTAMAIGARCRRWALLCCSWEETYLWRSALERFGMSYEQQGHWVKTNPKPQMDGRKPSQGAEAILIFHSRLTERRWNGGGKAATWYAPIPHGDERCHPTQKPSKLLRDLVLDFTDPGDLVADIFAGVATTGVAAIGSDRRFAGWELDPTHHANGLARLQDPLFTPATPSQSEFFPDLTKAKSASTRARNEIDRRVFDLIRAANGKGMSPAEIVEIVGGEDREIQRSLQRLHRAGVLRREGRTTSTRYIFAHNDQTGASL